MRETTAIEKLLTSLTNVITAVLMTAPLWFFFELSVVHTKWILIYMFLAHDLFSLFFKSKRDLGMVVMKTYWKKSYTISQRLVYAGLYTASFSTLLFWIFFPFDLFLINIFLFQLPCVLLTKTTLHGYLSGDITTVKKTC